MSWSTPDPTVGGLPGTGIYEGSGPGQCNCAFFHNYKFAFGPRVGVAYQINTKTVLRAGVGGMYGTTAKDLVRLRFRKSLFCGHFHRVVEARQDSFYYTAVYSNPEFEKVVDEYALTQDLFAF